MKWCAFVCALVVHLGGCSEATSTAGGADQSASSSQTANEATVEEAASDISMTSTTASDIVSEGEGVTVGPDAEVPDQEPIVVTGLVILPSDVLLFQVDEGQPEPVELTVWVHYSDGGETEVTDDVIWTTSDAAIINLEAGLPIITAEAEGQVMLVALYGSLHSTCSITVKMTPEPMVISEGLTDEELEAFEAGGEVSDEGGPEWTYPADGTVLPCGMYPPLIQWSPGATAWFRLVLVNNYEFEVTIYTTAASFQPTRELWGDLCAMTGGPIEMRLAGKNSLASDAMFHEAETRTVQGAIASLEGMIYYWELLGEQQTGSIMRLDSSLDIPASDPVFPEAEGTEKACRGCHALSLDGSKLAYAYMGPDATPSGLIKAKGILAVSNAEEPLPPLVPPQPEIGAQNIVFDPTGNLLVVGDTDGLWLARLTTEVDSGLEKIGDISTVTETDGLYRAETPAWSPDGSTLAFAWRGIDLTVAEGAAIHLAGWDHESETFEPSTQLLSIYDVDDYPFHDYPTWTPDSEWLAARSSMLDQGVGQPVDEGNLGFVLIDANTGNHMPLTKGAPQGPRYGRPSFSPFIEGGYFWMVFYSDRAYGNVTEEGSKQLWVMAVDQSPEPGEDPSHPAFWLPGQSLDGVNLSAFWAKPSCVSEAETCESDEECCIGLACEMELGATVGTCEPTGCEVPGEYCDFKQPNCCEGYSCQQSAISGYTSCQPIEDE